MSDKTEIEWTDATWNPVTGCSKVSAGCKHCYAERDWARLSANHATRYFGRKFTDVQCHDDVLGLPLRWTKPRRIFVNSMSDLFHADVPDEFIDRVFAVMALARRHTFQVLTKRPERMHAYLTAHRRVDQINGAIWSQLGSRVGSKIEHGGEWRCALPLPNVWLGVSVEDQSAADERIPLLLQTPAAVRWISAEPLLGPVSLRWLAAFPESAPHTAQHPSGRTNHLDGLRRLDWVVVGGESGPKARPMHLDWARSLRDQCAAEGVPFLFKQWGEWWPNCVIKEDGSRDETTLWMDRIGKKAAGSLLDGVQHDGYPETNV